jgi:hypothetical protein
VAREYDSWRYRERQLVECLVNKFKHFRRIFSRFDKLASRYLGFLHFAGTQFKPHKLLENAPTPTITTPAYYVGVGCTLFSAAVGCMCIDD